MDSTFPLHHDLIQSAIEQLSANNELALARSERPAAGLKSVDVLLSGSMHARVTGPVKGYYIASHAAQSGDGFRSYVGDYKICEALPSSYWSAQVLVAGCCRHRDGTGMAAMASAEAAATRQIDDMPILVDRL